MTAIIQGSPGTSVEDEYFPLTISYTDEDCDTFDPGQPIIVQD